MRYNLFADNYAQQLIKEIEKKINNNLNDNTSGDINDSIKKNTDNINDNDSMKNNENINKIPLSNEDHANICVGAFITVLDYIPIIDPVTVRPMLEDFIRDKKMSQTFCVILNIGARLTPNTKSSNMKTGYNFVSTCMDVDENIKFYLLYATLCVLLGEVQQANHFCYKALYLANYSSSLLKENLQAIQWSCALLQRYYFLLPRSTRDHVNSCRNFVLQHNDLLRISSVIDNLEAPDLSIKSVRFIQFEHKIIKLLQYPDYFHWIWQTLMSQAEGKDNERSDLARAYVSYVIPRALLGKSFLRSVQPCNDQQFQFSVYYIWEFITAATHLAAPYRALLFPR